jgi:hypothetical protein
MSLGDLNTAREKIAAAIDAHVDAVKRLSTGRGNALAIGERIKILGVKSKHRIPEMLIEGGTITTVIGEAIDDITSLSDEESMPALD